MLPRGRREQDAVSLSAMASVLTSWFESSIRVGGVIGVSLLLIGCHVTTEPAPVPRATAKERAASPLPAASASAEPSADANAATPEELAAERRADKIAQRLLDGQIGWSAEQRAFVVVTAFSEEGNGTGTTGEILFDPDAKDRKNQEEALCDPGAACDGDEQELMIRTSDWLLDNKLDRVVLVEPVAFSSGPVSSAELGAIGGKLTWVKDHLDLARPKQAPKSLPKFTSDPEWTAKPIAASASPDGQLLVVLFDMDPGKNYATGFNAFVEARVYKTP